MGSQTYCSLNSDQLIGIYGENVIDYIIFLESEKKISSELVNLEMRDDYYPQWFELFEALGLDRKKLEYMRDEYAKDPKVCMYEASRQWFQQGDPKPSWELICYVLRYKLLDPVHADRIEGILGLSDIPNPLLTQPGL